MYNNLETASAVALTQRKQLTANNLTRRLPRTYGTERIVGMPFRYHTQVEAFDGWRPPLHDPQLDVCYWLRNHQAQLAVGSAVLSTGCSSTSACFRGAR